MKNSSSHLPWWKTTIVYQVYPRSFKDDTRDGIGDLDGIISKLDHIKELGCETIWFSPFFESPQKDFGYDISDYKNIAPEYGDFDTCLSLIEEIHSRDMKVLFDMVLNHTSDQHPWFLESRASRENPKRDWYIWRNGKRPGGKAPPNNWKSVVSGSGWHYDPDTDQWYWATFLPFQPDLNYRNPEVKKTMLDIVRFWLDQGVDGFRLDIFDALFKDDQLRNNPFRLRYIPSSDHQDLFFQSRKMNCHHPDTFEFARELRAVLDEYREPPRYLVGEVTGSYDILRSYCGDKEPDRLHSVFLFQAMEAEFSAPAFRKLIQEAEAYFPDPFIPTWVFSNHDRTRRISVLGDDPEKAKLNAAFQLTVRGIPFLYYGEEVGMNQVEVPYEKALDPVAARFKKLPGFVTRFIHKITGGAANRDGCRTPMQWNDSPNAGFCFETIDPWLPVHPDYRNVNVNVEKVDPNSVYYCYKRFLKARQEQPALNSGMIELLGEEELPEEVLGYKRYVELDDSSDKNSAPEALQEEPQELLQEVTVLLNFSGRKQTVRGAGSNRPQLVVSTYSGSEPFGKDGQGGWTITLAPYEGLVYTQS